MARRTAATITRPPIHVYREDKETPGTCARCHLIKRNEAHVDENDPRLTELDQAQEEHRRRIGDDI